jgi:hypothetical protein
MKSPDDALTRKAQLRRALVEAFVAGDIPAWREATVQLARMLREEGLPRTHDRSEKARLRRALVLDAQMSSRILPKKRGTGVPPPTKSI